MSNKSSIQQLAATLAEKDGLEQAAAERFVKAMFDIANEALQDDKQVKMRWLGTFKVLAVKDRESVDVNTGERIMIEGRDKISFTPDNILKEIVNKPFAQFETVTVNDGVDFTEIDERFAMMEEENGETTVPQQATEAHEATETTEVSPEPVTTEASLESGIRTGEEESPETMPELSGEEEHEEAEPEFVPVLSGEKEKDEKIERIKSEREGEEKPSEEKPSAPNPEEPKTLESHAEGTTEEEPEADSPAGRSHVVIPRYVAVVACCLIVALVGGMGWFAFNYGKMSAQRDYLAHQRDFLTSQLNAAKHPQPAAKADTLPSPEDSVQQELRRKAREDSARMARVSQAIEGKDQEQPDGKNAEDTKKAQQGEYDGDVRIRTGAYRIVGVAQKVKVKPGQTLSSISKTYLGAGMECYIEALNDVSKVSAGQEIKIPKLELKKTRKNN